MSKKIPGFCYVTGQATAQTREAWEKDIAYLVSRGGRRRVEKGETFAHDAKGVLCFEVYANVRDVADVSDLL